MLRVTAAMVCLLLGASAAPAAVVFTQSGGWQGSAYDVDTNDRAIDSLDLDPIGAVSEIRVLDGVSRGRADVDTRAGRLGTSGSISPATGVDLLNISGGVAHLSFNYRVDRDATITFGGAYSGSLRHGDGVDPDVRAEIRLFGNVYDEPGETSAFLADKPGDFSGDLLLSQTVTQGRLYYFEATLISRVAGRMLDGAHSLEFLLGIDTGGAVLTLAEEFPTPVPLPASAALLGAGLAALALLRRRGAARAASLPA